MLLTLTLSTLSKHFLLIDIRSSCPHFRGCRPVPSSGLCIPLSLSYPGHTPISAVQRGTLHCQGPGQVRNYSSHNALLKLITLHFSSLENLAKSMDPKI